MADQSRLGMFGYIGKDGQITIDPYNGFDKIIRRIGDRIGWDKMMYYNQATPTGLVMYNDAGELELMRKGEVRIGS